MGLTWQDFAIAVFLAVVVGAIGFMVGQASGMLWLSYAGGFVGGIYLFVKYIRADQS